MGIIIALLVFNCNLHLNQNWCVEQHVSCVKTISSIKLGGEFGLLSQEQKLAVGYMYCIENDGNISNDIDLNAAVEAFKAFDFYGGFHAWERPGYLQALQPILDH